MTPTEMFCGLSMYCGCKVNWTRLFIRPVSTVPQWTSHSVAIALAPPQVGYQLHGYTNGLVISCSYVNSLPQSVPLD